MTKTRLQVLLCGGDRRSIGKANAVVAAVLADQVLFSDVIDGLFSSDRLVRMRCADVAEKASRVHPDCLKTFETKLLSLARTSPEQEVRWHLAQMLPRLALNKSQRRSAIGILRRHLKDESRIVQVSALQGLAEFADKDAELQEEFRELCNELLTSESAAVRARARKLVARAKSRKLATKVKRRRSS
jgi:hypothetical protein